MKRKLKIYLPFVNAGMQEVATYRVNWIFFMLGEALSCFVTYFIWAAVYSSGSKESMKSYNATFLFQELGNKLPTEIAIAVPMIITVEIIRTVMSGMFEFNVLRLVLYILSCALAYLINFYFNICFGFIAFVIKYLWGANMMKNVIVGFLSGMVIPLSFLPEAIEKVFLFLPFSSLNYTPVMIYMGKYGGTELLYCVGLQIFWVLFFFGLSKLLWKASVKRLSAQGG